MGQKVSLRHNLHFSPLFSAPWEVETFKLAKDARDVQILIGVTCRFHVWRGHEDATFSSQVSFRHWQDKKKMLIYRRLGTIHRPAIET